MSYRIAQDFEYVGKDYWRWSAWIEADDAELDKVKEVVWILHPSFKEPRRVVTERSDNFRLNTAGWDDFLLRAQVVLADGEKRLLKHNLRLEYPDKEAAATEAAAQVRRQRCIYLSYSQQDSRVARKLRAGLENAGLKVLDQTRLGKDEPWSEALMEQYDVVVGLVGEDGISPRVSDEIQTAMSSSKPTLLLVPVGASSAEIPKGVQTHTIDMNRLDPTAIAEFLRSAEIP
jgi:hypothetical protein